MKGKMEIFRNLVGTQKVIDEVPGSEIFMNIQSSFRVYKYIYKSSTVIKGVIWLTS